MYAAFVPPLSYDADAQTFVGGLFLDGRVDSLEAQAGRPFLNPAEMNQPDEAAVVARLRRAPYAPLFDVVFGPGALDDAHAAYDRMTRALAAFERTRRFAPFSSRYDAYLAGRGHLTAREMRGLALFEDPRKGNCAACHPSRPGPHGEPPMFTDFTYDNIGIPRNPAVAATAPDRGLGATIGDPAQDGKFRVPTLRNIALTAPYGHNGYFRDLRAVVDFYDTRDVRPWPPPEVPATVNHDELGDLGLSCDEVDAIVAFLHTLTDHPR
jgi:cytochrome c peroxidase